jgi:hypothetical protein
MNLSKIIAKIPALPKISPLALLGIALVVIGFASIVAHVLPGLPAVALLACKAIAALSLIGLVVISLALSIKKDSSSNHLHPSKSTAVGAFPSSAAFGHRSVAEARLPLAASPTQLPEVDAGPVDCPVATSSSGPTYRA